MPHWLWGWVGKEAGGLGFRTVAQGKVGTKEFKSRLEGRGFGVFGLRIWAFEAEELTG